MILIDYSHQYKIDRLLQICQDQPKIFRVKMAAAIYKGNRLVSYGFNSEKSHPFQAKWSRHPEAIYTHAEIDAIRNALKRDVDLTRCNLYIARVTIRGQGLAEPCSGCHLAIKAFGLKNAFWTLDKSGIGSYYDCRPFVIA